MRERSGERLALLRAEELDDEKRGRSGQAERSRFACSGRALQTGRRCSHKRGEKEDNGSGKKTETPDQIKIDP